MIPKMPHTFGEFGSLRVLDPRDMMENFQELARALNNLGIENFARDANGALPLGVFQNQKAIATIILPFDSDGMAAPYSVPPLLLPTGIGGFIRAISVYGASTPYYDDGYDGTNWFIGDLYAEPDHVLVAHLESTTRREQIFTVGNIVSPVLTGKSMLELSVSQGSISGGLVVECVHSLTAEP